MSRCGVAIGIISAAISFAPAPPEAPPSRQELARARVLAARKQFEEVWTYYRQSRTADSFPTYYWSRLVLDAEIDYGGRTNAATIAAYEAHLERMKKLQELVDRVRRLGFSFSTDVGATEYYRLEAEYWLAGAKGE
jgi:hypothetical protein